MAVNWLRDTESTSGLKCTVSDKMQSYVPLWIWTT